MSFKRVLNVPPRERGYNNIKKKCFVNNNNNKINPGERTVKKNFTRSRMPKKNSIKSIHRSIDRSMDRFRVVITWCVNDNNTHTFTHTLTWIARNCYFAYCSIVNDDDVVQGSLIKTIFFLRWHKSGYGNGGQCDKLLISFFF